MSISRSVPVPPGSFAPPEAAAPPAAAPPLPPPPAPAAPAGSAPREITVPPGLAPAAEAEAPAPAAPRAPDPADHDEDDENDKTVLARPKPRAKPAGPAWTLVLPDGTRETIAGTVVVGRRPAKTAFPGADRSLLLKDPDGQVSKSHAVFQTDEEGLWVRDLASTNGVVVIAPGGEETSVEGDARVAVPSGAEVELGGYVITAEREG